MYFVLTPRETRLPLYIGGVGLQTPQNEMIRPKGQIWHQLAFVFEGCGRLTTQSGQYDLKQGDCFILARNSPHAYTPHEPPFHVLWVIYNGSAARQITDLLTDSAGGGCFTLHDRERLFAKSQGLMYAAEAHADMTRLSPMLYELLLETLRQKEITASVRLVTERLAPALAFMEAHLAEPLTLGAIADSISLSKFTFCKLFRETYAMTPFAYLMQLRLQHAKNMLSQNRDCTVKEAALSSGFRDVSYFGAAFRRFENMTPKSFQQQFGSADR